MVSQVQAVSFYLVGCVGVLSVIGQNKLSCDWSEKTVLLLVRINCSAIGQNKLLCDWSAWIRLGVQHGPKKGRLSNLCGCPAGP
jgi:hypothetical protein